MPITKTYVAPPDKAVDEAITENDWDVALKGNIEYAKEYLDELAIGIQQAQITADVATSTHTEAAPLTAITIPLFTLTAVTSVIVEFFGPGATGGGASGISLWDSGVDLGRIADTAQVSGALNLRARVSLGIGGHTLALRIWGTTTIHAGPGGVGAKLPAVARAIPA